MKKKIVSFLLAASMILGCAGCGSTGNGAAGSSATASAAQSAASVTASASASASSQADSAGSSASDASEGEPTHLVMTFRTFGTVPNDIDKVSAALSKITEEKINADVDLIIIQSGSYKEQVTLMLSGDEQLDVVGLNLNLIPQVISSEQITPLDDLLDKYGSGVKEALGDDLLKCGVFDGKTYYTPLNCDLPNGMGAYVLRKDICDKYGINAADITSYDDLTAAFAKVHEAEPNLQIFAPTSVGSSPMQYNVTFDKLSNYFGVLENWGQDLKVTNLFESEAYKNYVNVIHSWYESGYLSKDVVNATEAGGSLMKAGNLFCYPTATKPGIDIQEQNSSGCEVEIAQVLPTLKVTNNNWQWAIPESSENKEKAMEFLNLMYTDPDVINLLAYGIEGEDYEKKDDGTIGYPDGIDATNVGYSMNSMVWSFGNEFNAYVWQGNDPDVWAQTKEFNTASTNKVSKAYGFTFNPSNVSNEISAVQNVYDQYRMSLECGVVDPESTLTEMNSALYSAGLQTIIDEKQKQLDAWAAENGVK